MFFYILKVCFIATADNSYSLFFAKADNSTFHVFWVKKHSFNLCNLLRWRCRCLTNVVVVIIDCVAMITCNTLSFSLTVVMRCFCKVPWKRFWFLFYALKNISLVQVHRNYPSSITFSQLWWNSSQLARLFKVKVALSPDLNTARWFAKIYLSAFVHKLQGRLSASAVKRELLMPWKWTIRLFWSGFNVGSHCAQRSVYRFLQINFTHTHIYIYIYIYILGVGID